MAKKSFNQMLKESPIPVLVDFYAEWCGPCKAMSPALAKYATEMEGRLKVIKVNVDKNQAAAQHYNVRGVPTLILFKNGKILWQQAGALATVAQLHQAVTSRL
ncbi:MAG: thioredoxin [Bacteroidetes bacterium]|nr:thioredoxin [Bacteroidota bacterium]